MSFPEVGVIFATVLLLSCLKGAFGGGFGILGIPLMALAIDPVHAGGLLAPLFVVTDGFALRYWPPSTWSKGDVLTLTPFLLVGIAVGYACLAVLDERHVALVVGTISLAFAAHALLASTPSVRIEESKALGAVAGTCAGFTSMTAHSGGPPISIYLQLRGLDKAAFVGTTSIVFSIGNMAKAGPWLLLAPPTEADVVLMLCCVPLCASGVWLGWHLHRRLDRAQVFRFCNLLLVFVGLKLLSDGLA